MTYTPKPGDFGVIRIQGPIGLFIRIGQWLCDGVFADYEHAFIYIGGICNDFPDTDGIVEAQPHGAHIDSLSKYDGEHILWYSCPDDKSFSLSIKAIFFVGTPYSFLDYFSIAFQHGPKFIRKLLGKRLQNYVASTKHMICSQLVDAVYQRAGIQLFNDGRFPGNVTPADLYEIALSQTKSTNEH